MHKINYTHLIAFYNNCTRKYSKFSYIHHVGKEPLRALTIGNLLEETSSKCGHRHAVMSRHQKQSITFQEVLTQSTKLAAGLKKLGLEKGDRLGLLAPNLIEWYIANMASARAGLILVALNPAYQHLEVEYCINKVGVKAMICGDKFKSQDYYQLLLSVAPEIADSDPGKLSSSKVPSLKSLIFISESAKKGAFSFKEILDFASSEDILGLNKLQNYISPDDPCNIQFTSGTTGKPKATVTSHYNMTNNGYYIGKRNELDTKHRKACVQVPFFHAYGTVIALMAALNHGTTLVLPTDGYSPDKSLDAIKEEKCDLIYGTPTMYVDLVHTQEQRNEDISPEIAVSGGALCAPHLFKSMLKVLKVKKVKSVYGLTETTAVVFQSLYEDDEVKSTTTVGHVGDHIEAKVVDENGNLVPFGTPGELCVRTYANMLEYWGDEEKTKEIYGRDKWLKTGDQFVLTEDGYGRVVGRLKEMIVRGGENIFPKEIEDYLSTHPDILECHVIGLPHERLGEEVCACIRLKPGSTITHEQITKFCKGEIANFKIPSKIHVVEDFPKTTSGKIQKFKLVEQIK